MANLLFRTLLITASLAVPAFADEPTPPPAGAPEEAPASKPYPTGIQCVFVPFPFGFSTIDDKHLIIDGSATRKYLVTLMSRCFNLRHALGIGLDRHGSQLCSGDAILAKDERCVIRYIEQVKDAREGTAIVEARLAAEEAERKKKSP